MASKWPLFREPLRDTILRNCAIAIVGGLVIARFARGLSHWWIPLVLLLWPTFGGHFMEVWFLNWLRPRLPFSRAVQVAARVTVWFIAGMLLMLCMQLTSDALGLQAAHWPAWWLAGLAFIGIELLAHVAPQLRGQPSFYNGRG